MVERVAVTIAGRLVKRADVPIFFQPPKLAIIRNVAPDKIQSDGIPCRAFRPQSTGVKALYGCVSDSVLFEAFIESDYVRIGVPHRIVAAPVPHCLAGAPSLSPQ